MEASLHRSYLNQSVRGWGVGGGAPTYLFKTAVVRAHRSTHPTYIICFTAVAVDYLIYNTFSRADGLVSRSKHVAAAVQPFEGNRSRPSYGRRSTTRACSE